MRVFVTLGTILALYLIASGTHAQICGEDSSLQRWYFGGRNQFEAETWPWHGAMFYKKDVEQFYTCSVTILTWKFVITSADCTFDHGEMKFIPATKIKVKVGLTNLQSSDQYVQQHDVIRIIRHDEYDVQTYANNIAVMELYTNIKFNDYVKVACLWQDDTSLQNIVSKAGQVVGWGNYEKMTLAHIVSEQECVDNRDDYYFQFSLPTNTFCAGYRNETSINQEYSGGGLFIHDLDVWLLRGIVSNWKINETSNVETKMYTIFTDVPKYMSWIKTYVTFPSYIAEPIDSSNRNTSIFVPAKKTKVSTDDDNAPTTVRTEKTQEYTATRKCGQSQVFAQKLIFNGYTAQAGAWPWHGAMFQKFLDGKTSYACGITILSEQFVITAAHCTFDQQEGQRLPPERAYIKVGLTNLESSDRYAQQHKVVKIIRHNEYDEEVLENDIALMKLYTEITYNIHVQPICLWQGDTSLEKLKSQIGYTVGWGYDQDYGLPKDLHEATMPIVTRRECIDSDPDYYRKYIFEHKTFCAGYRNGTTSAPGDSGGGLYLRQGNSWALRGIISNTKFNPNTLTVDTKSFVVLTDVSYYTDWIKFQVTNEEPIEIG